MSVSAIQLNPSYTPPASFSVSNTIKEISLICFKELAASLAIGVALSPFISNPAGFTILISTAIIQVTVSAFFHSVGIYASYKTSQKGPYEPYFQKVTALCNFVTGVNFGYFSGFNGQTLIHEMGHAAAALLIYKNPYPQIEIHPFLGGNTQLYKTAKTDFGKWLKPSTATWLMIGSGPALTLLVSSALLAIGLAMREKYPNFGKYLIGWGLVDFAYHAWYARSAIHADLSNLSHDFLHLSIFGLDPTAAAIGIIAVPIFIYLGVCGLKKSEERKEPLNQSPLPCTP